MGKLAVNARVEQVKFVLIEEVSPTKQRFVGRSYSSEAYISPIECERNEGSSLQCTWHVGY